MAEQTPYNIWKVDKDGNERPLEEQLSRRQEDLRITDQHIAWYNKNPLHRDPLKKAASHQKRIEHRKGVASDIKILIKRIPNDENN
tara:strand:- start:262 stop:519 length:258 start_codon:yes stop_codon:yes gene_type:complete